VTLEPGFMVELSDGAAIPQIGMGVYQLDRDRGLHTLLDAIEIGYRHFDTAAAYGNEAVVGEAIRRSGMPRSDFYIVTKLPVSDQGVTTRASLEGSLTRLGVDCVDLYLIHWPAPLLDRYVESWEQIIEARNDGLVKSAGVSNFDPVHLDRINAETGHIPAMNQIELHPGLQQRQLRARHAELGIATAAWSPLARGATLRSPTITEIASRLDHSPAQVTLRWHVQLGIVVIPKSNSVTRLRENWEVQDFELSSDDMAAIDALDAGQRTGPDPYLHNE
jgi:2,5-diketo-D-gluconate reductase A